MTRETKISNLYQTTHQSNEYHYYFDQELGEPCLYRDLSQTLVQAHDGDVINLMINGPGGYVSTATQLVNLIANSRATVVGHLLGPSASAYTSIFLACHAWVVHPHATLMAHTFTGGFYEKGTEIGRSLNSFEEFMDDFMADIYYPFYTEEELEDIIKNNRNLYLNSKEINRRLETVVEYRKAEFEKANANGGIVHTGATVLGVPPDCIED